MQNELKTFIDYMEREKGVERSVLVDTVKSSLESAVRKSVSEIANPIIQINSENFQVTVFGEFLVIPDNKLAKINEIRLSEVKKNHPEAQLGQSVLVEVTPNNLGRIAAQTAKQVIVQKLREAEANVVFNEYKDKVFQIITGTVRQHERRNVVIDLGRGEAILPPREQVENEEYRVGDRLKLLVIDVSKSSQNPEIIVSRSHPVFVKKMFEIEVPEIADQTVEIKGIAREAGYRTKIAVFSKDAKVDCVGACVGMRGARVKNIVQELNGEKIDIVPWSSDIQTYCRNALNPAKLRHIVSNDEEKQLLVYVDKGQFSLAIGKRGNNVRLTSKLLGWRVDIEALEKDVLPVSATPSSEENADLPVGADPLDIPLDSIEGLSKKVKEFLMEAGYSSLAQLKNINSDELYAIPGVGKTSAEEIMEHIKKATKHYKNM